MSVMTEDMITGLKIVNLSDRLPKNPTNSYPTRSLSQIKQIIIHHSAINSNVGPERIAQVQISQGKAGISYHYFVAEDGSLHQTNPLTTVSAHTAGQDQNSIAICFAGNFTEAIPTQAQLAAGGG
jgi:hypothetical protein